MAQWVARREEADIGLMSRVMGISEIVAQVMVNRGIRTRNTALAFLRHESDAGDGLGMKDMEAGLECVADAVEKNHKIVVYGDYDADGVMSTVILVRALTRLGANVLYYIPQRTEEGYGLNSEAVRGMAEIGAQLVLACDNGISAIAEAELCAELGMRLVIIDHHEPAFTDHDGTRADIIPRAAAIIDPKQKACPYPFKHMCAAGLSYKFVKLLYAKLGRGLVHSGEYTALAAIATVCDIVELSGENRSLVAEGIRIINESSPNIGLGALIRAKGYEGRKIDTQAIGFILGPSINASGRLDHARYAVELFLTEDSVQADEIAAWLVRINEERRRLTKEAFTSIDSMLDRSELDGVVVVYAPKVHESIAGIVAGRIKDKHYRPTIIITSSTDGTPEGPGAKGSARSIEGYNIFEELYKRRGLLTRFGGHPMAAGMSLPKENIDELRRSLNEGFPLQADALVPRLYYDAELSLSQVSFALAQELLLLEPFGKGNRPPVFCSRGVKPDELRLIPEKDTIIATFNANGRRVKALCFGKLEELRGQLLEKYSEEDAMRIIGGDIRRQNLVLDMLYEIEINEYNGKYSVQMRLRDFVLAEPREEANDWKREA